MFGQLLASVVMAAEAAPSNAVATAADSPATGHVFAFAIALAAFLVIGTALFFHRWNQRRANQR